MNGTCSYFDDSAHLLRSHAHKNSAESWIAAMSAWRPKFFRLTLAGYPRYSLPAGLAEGGVVASNSVGAMDCRDSRESSRTRSDG